MINHMPSSIIIMSQKCLILFPCLCTYMTTNCGKYFIFFWEGNEADIHIEKGSTSQYYVVQVWAGQPNQSVDANKINYLNYHSCIAYMVFLNIRLKRKQTKQKIRPPADNSPKIIDMER